jgi:hypothetical protein
MDPLPGIARQESAPLFREHAVDDPEMRRSRVQALVFAARRSNHLGIKTAPRRRARTFGERDRHELPDTTRTIRPRTAPGPTGPRNDEGGTPARDASTSVAAGGELYVCGHCAAVLKIAESNLIKGAVVTKHGDLFKKLPAAALSFSY